MGALVIVSVAVFGVISYITTCRTQEFGIRMALGARPVDVVKLIVTQGMATAFSGMAIGLVGSRALSHLLSSLLFGVVPDDGTVFIGVPVALSVVAGVACVLPSIRVMKINLGIALNYQ